MRRKLIHKGMHVRQPLRIAGCWTDRVSRLPRQYNLPSVWLCRRPPRTSAPSSHFSLLLESTCGHGVPKLLMQNAPPSAWLCRRQPPAPPPRAAVVHCQLDWFTANGIPEPCWKAPHLQRGCAGGHLPHLRAQQPHPEHVQLLPLHVLATWWVLRGEVEDSQHQEAGDRLETVTAQHAWRSTSSDSNGTSRREH